IDRDTATNWSAAEVIEQWQRLFKGSVLSQRYSQQETLSRAEQDALNLQISEWRERLMSICWFMRCLNEPIPVRPTRKTTSLVVSGPLLRSMRSRHLCIPAHRRSIQIPGLAR
ncbi:MAG: hypothetical protein QNK31_03350, partial [Porticoccus sp.]|nr:hypothetical protein [Porticoccus sp.]